MLLLLLLSVTDIQIVIHNKGGQFELNVIKTIPAKGRSTKLMLKIMEGSAALCSLASRMVIACPRPTE